MPKHTNTKEAREKRKRRNPDKWTLEMVAQRLGISVNYLTRLENGLAQNPSIDLLNKMISLYGVKDGLLILEDYLNIDFSNCVNN